jgi:hypothetical protein
VSTPSVTPVATGTTSVFHSDPVTRFQQAIDLELKVNDYERQVRRLAWQLPSVPPVQPRSRRRSRRSAW